jgi:hypothetical protein
MAFRQHNKNPETAWRKDHRDELLRNGLPASVIDDERRWTYVLLHGDDEFGSGWDPSWITREQAGRLLTLVRSQYTNPAGLDLIRALQKRHDAE